MRPCRMRVEPMHCRGLQCNARVPKGYDGHYCPAGCGMNLGDMDDELFDVHAYYGCAELAHPSCGVIAWVRLR